MPLHPSDSKTLHRLIERIAFTDRGSHSLFVSTGLEVRACSKRMVAEVENAGARLKKDVCECGNKPTTFTVITTSLLVVNGGGASTGIGTLTTEFGVVAGVGAGRQFDNEEVPKIGILNLSRTPHESRQNPLFCVLRAVNMFWGIWDAGGQHC
jgi:hypothetical protein